MVLALPSGSLQVFLVLMCWTVTLAKPHMMWQQRLTKVQLQNFNKQAEAPAFFVCLFVCFFAQWCQWGLLLKYTWFESQKPAKLVHFLRGQTTGECNIFIELKQCCSVSLKTYSATVICEVWCCVIVIVLEYFGKLDGQRKVKLPQCRNSGQDTMVPWRTALLEIKSLVLLCSQLACRWWQCLWRWLDFASRPFSSRSNWAAICRRALWESSPCSSRSGRVSAAYYFETDVCVHVAVLNTEETSLYLLLRA